jgi:hypothetical protein
MRTKQEHFCQRTVTGSCVIHVTNGKLIWKKADRDSTSAHWYGCSRRRNRTMQKLLPAIAAALIITPLIAGSAHAAFGSSSLRGGAGRPSAGGPAVGGGGGQQGGGGGFVGRPGGGPGGGGGGFVGGPGRNFGGGPGRPGGWDHDRWRGRFRGSVVFVDPWYDPFWPYGYGFGWGYGWYGPPRYVDRVTEYAPPVPDQDYGPPPEQYWYYCSNPDGYYPYVQSCNGDWQPVPVTPPPNGPPPRPSASSSQPEDRPGG